MRKKLLLVLGAILLAVLVRMSLFTVDRSEFVYLTQFGRHVATYDGAEEDQAGLHFRWPWPVQTVVRVDRRLQYLDLPPAELVTEDPRSGTIDKTLAIDGYVVWRVPDAEAAERFIVTVGTPEQARDILRDRIRGRLGAAVARMQLDDLISDRADPARPEGRWVDRKRDDLRRSLLRPYTAIPAEDGIEIVDVRIRRLNYPTQVRQAIFDRIISERRRKVAEETSRGKSEAANIASRTEAEISIQKAAADAKNRRDRAQAEARADVTLNAAISKDPDYYAELKSREIGEMGLDSRKKVWSTRLFGFYFPLPASGGVHPRRSDRRDEPGGSPQKGGR
jgi:membrane protease subunit HflC